MPTGGSRKGAFFYRLVLPAGKVRESPTAAPEGQSSCHIDARDKQIDQLDYKLYELMEEEIKIVEGQKQN